MNAGIQHKLDEIHDVLNELDSIFANLRRAGRLAQKIYDETNIENWELKQQVNALERYNTDHEKLVRQIDSLTEHRQDVKSTLQGILSAVKALGAELRQQG